MTSATTTAPVNDSATTAAAQSNLGSGNNGGRSNATSGMPSWLPGLALAVLAIIVLMMWSPWKSATPPGGAGTAGAGTAAGSAFTLPQAPPAPTSHTSNGVTTDVVPTHVDGLTVGKVSAPIQGVCVVYGLGTKTGNLSVANGGDSCLTPAQKQAQIDAQAKANASATAVAVKEVMEAQAAAQAAAAAAKPKAVTKVVYRDAPPQVIQCSGCTIKAAP